MDRVIIVSACLIGFNCRYDGKNSMLGLLVNAYRYGKVVPLCPEQLGGLSTPRKPSKITCGDGFDVLNGKAKVLMPETNIDVTSNFLKGAFEALKAAALLGSKLLACILKEKSPSCGVKSIYKFEVDELKRGMGVAAALLSQNGINVVSSDDEKNIEKFVRELYG